MFYKSISQVYDYIFPQNKAQLDFISRIKEIHSDEKILDIGCATGSLTELISRYTVNVTGIDLDADLLKVAVGKYPELKFKQKNMLNINKDFPLEHFDRVISFGNTLVHLSSREEVVHFFNSVYNSLKNGGLFIVQIINYNRIIQEEIKELPLIDNEFINFKREYKLYDGWLDFITTLDIKKSGQRINNSLPLLALTEEEIRKITYDTGFRELKFYGNLQGDPLLKTSIPLLFSCIK